MTCQRLGPAAASRSEEFREHLRRRRRRHTAEHFRPVIQPRMTQQIGHRAGHSRLRIPRAKHDACHARQHDRARAHRARLERHVERAAVQSPRLERRRRRANRDRLGVRRRILIANRSVAGARQNHAVAHDHRADRHFARRFGGARLVERGRHPLLVLRSRRRSRRYAPIVALDGSFENSNAPFPSGRTTIESPSPNRPSSTAIASGFWISR